jgi:hypothetical protein
MRTFKYTGKNPTHLFIHEGKNHEVKKGEPFTTDNPRLADMLAEREDIEEVKDQPKEAAKEAEPKRSRPESGKS